LNNFTQFDLSSGLLRAIEDMKYQEPTPIQTAAIPVGLAGRDIIGCAQTGTGKTAAFSIPLISRLIAGAASDMALILAPTRELAAQIVSVMEQLCRKTSHFKPVLLIGGVSMSPQIQALSQSPRIIVATPGRLVDHLKRRTVSLSGVKIFVLDEADRMFDMGFQPQLNEVLKRLPKQRQTMLFSATLPKDVLALAAKLLHDPVSLNVGATSKPVEKIAQEVLRTTHADKNKTLVNALKVRPGSVLVFARTKSRTDRLARLLQGLGHNVDRLHGDRSQSQRTKALEGFRRGRFRILVATDIAARGIDISHIQHVINYDLPSCSDDYIHRIGRTGRAGASGCALALVTPEDEKQWREIQDRMKSVRSA
jgi:ATP-dependent RNA helicase RhlE